MWEKTKRNTRIYRSAVRSTNKDRSSINLLSIEKSTTVITFVQFADLPPFSSSICTSSHRLDIARNTEQRLEINSRGQGKIILLPVETRCIRAGCSLTEHYVTYPVASRVRVPDKWLIKHCFSSVFLPLNFYRNFESFGSPGDNRQTSRDSFPWKLFRQYSMENRTIF